MYIEHLVSSKPGYGILVVSVQLYILSLNASTVLEFELEVGEVDKTHR